MLANRQLAQAPAPDADAGPAARIPCRVVVRARDLAGFVACYRQHIDGDRIFIFTRMPPAPGTSVRFQIHLETGDCVLRGDGVVLRAVPDGPGRAGGMELRFVAADEPSRLLVHSLRARSRDGVPVAVIEDEKTIATGPPEFFTPTGPAPRCRERGTPETAIDTPSAPVHMLDLAGDDVEYLVDWSNDAAPAVATPRRRVSPPAGVRAVARRARAAAAARWRSAAARLASRRGQVAVGLAFTVGVAFAFGFVVGLVVGHR